MAGIRVASGPVSAVRREFLTLAKVTWVVPRMTAHTYAGLLSDHKWTTGRKTAASTDGPGTGAAPTRSFTRSSACSDFGARTHRPTEAAS